jgi:hypothetical protein
LKSQFFPFNEAKKDIIPLHEEIKEYADYLKLAEIELRFDDRYISGPISATGIILLSDAIRKAAEALGRAAGIIDRRTEEAATMRVAAIFDAIHRGGDVNKLLPWPTAATASAAKPPRELKAGDGGGYGLSPTEMEAVAKGDSTLFGLLRRYAALLESTPLPEDGLRTKEQARAARRLVSTYRNLVKRQKEVGLEPAGIDSRITTAERLTTAFYRKERRKVLTDARQRRLPAATLS